MAMTLESVIEDRVQRQLARGVYSEPSELLAHALDLVEAEEEWLLLNKVTINADLDESFEQAARGEGYSMEEVQAMIARRLGSRAA